VSQGPKWGRWLAIWSTSNSKQRGKGTDKRLTTGDLTGEEWGERPEAVDRDGGIDACWSLTGVRLGGHKLGKQGGKAPPEGGGLNNRGRAQNGGLPQTPTRNVEYRKDRKKDQSAARDEDNGEKG